jgi:hypothetical protein
MQTTISLIEQIKASREIYRKALDNIESLTDSELRAVLDGSASSDTTVDRVLSFASDTTVDRVLSFASAATLARVLSFASDTTVDRVLSFASDATVDRVLSFASDTTLARVLSFASATTVDRVLSFASAATLARVLSFASDTTVARIGVLKSLEVPIVENLDQKVLEATEAGNLEMGLWHSCETTHCRAGWAITYGGEAGRKLEEEVGPEMAGRLIYEASTGRPAPDFYASNEAAAADIRRCAALAN